MAIELHHLNTHGMMEQAGNVLDGVVRLKERIAGAGPMRGSDSADYGVFPGRNGDEEKKIIFSSYLLTIRSR
jgi:hypothetical protein